jgi:hypothetical protein
MPKPQRAEQVAQQLALIGTFLSWSTACGTIISRIIWLACS